MVLPLYCGALAALTRGVLSLSPFCFDTNSDSKSPPIMTTAAKNAPPCRQATHSVHLRSRICCMRVSEASEEKFGGVSVVGWMGAGTGATGGSDSRRLSGAVRAVSNDDT